MIARPEARRVAARWIAMADEDLVAGLTDARMSS